MQDQLDLMFSQLVSCTSLSELAILMPLVNTASAEENYLTDGLSKIAPEKLVRGLAGIRSIKLRQAFNFHTNNRFVPNPFLHQSAFNHKLKLDRIKGTRINLEKLELTELR